MLFCLGGTALILCRDGGSSAGQLVGAGSLLITSRLGGSALLSSYAGAGEGSVVRSVRDARLMIEHFVVVFTPPSQQFIICHASVTISLQDMGRLVRVGSAGNKIYHTIYGSEIVVVHANRDLIRKTVIIGVSGCLDFPTEKAA